MTFGSYKIIRNNNYFAIGFNNQSTVQPYVTWLFDGSIVGDAVFHDKYIDAINDFTQRSLRKINQIEN